MTRLRSLKSIPLPLTTPRLILREFREQDFDDIHHYGSQPDVVRFMIWGPNTEEETREFLDRKLAKQAARPRADVSVAAELIAKGRVMGALELRILDPASRTGEFGYCFGREHWNQGYATEAAGALIRVGFETLGLRRITANCDQRNTGSWRVMEKLGMRREGAFRQDVRARRGWRDSYLYAVLASEWRARNAPGGSS